MRKPGAKAHSRTHGAPVTSFHGIRSYRGSQCFCFRTHRAYSVRIEERWGRHWHIEIMTNKAAGLAYCPITISLAERVVKETRQNVFFFS